MKPFVSKARGFARRFKRQLCAAGALLFLVGTATAANDVNSERIRREDNSERLARLHPWARPKIAAVISDLEGHGYRPLIDGQVWRSPAQQAALKAAGKSTVSYSFHTVTDLDAKGKRTVPASLAADITDKRWGWDSPRVYWLTMARSAESHGLVTGIRWGLSTANRRKIDTAIANRDFDAEVPLGWDVAHNEPQSEYITLSQAKAGKRPPVNR